MAALQLLTLPFVALNFFGMLGGAVWLVILGKWYVLATGIGMSLFAAGGILVALTPAMLISMIAVPFFGRRVWYLGFPFILAGSIYTSAIAGAWCFLVVTVCVEGAGADATLPALLWAYGVAISPLQYLAARGSRGPDGAWDADVAVTFWSQFAVVVMGGIILVKGFDLPTLAWACAAPMILCTVQLAAVGIVLMKETAKRAAFKRLLGAS